MFAARFREAAARALLLPRRRPDQRTPLWQQRQRAADLLAVASKYPSFPILLEATRECCNDVFDLPALRRLLTEVRSRTVRIVEVETPAASPFARSLLFGWIAVYMYEGDAPLAERRAAALALDRDLLRDLLGAEELRSLLDAVGRSTPSSSSCSGSPRGAGARDADELHDLLRVLGPFDRARAGRPGRRLRPPAGGRVVGGAARTPASCSPCRSRASSVSPRQKTPPVCVTHSASPCPSGCRPASPTRSTRRCATSSSATPAPTVRSPPRRSRGGSVRRASPSPWRSTCSSSPAESSPASSGPGECTASGATPTCCVRSAAGRSPRCATRSSRSRATALGPLPPAVAGGGLQPARRRRGGRHRRGAAGRSHPRVVCSSPTSCRSRVAGYQPSDLDLLCTTGEVVWLGAGSVGAHDGRVRLVFRDQVPVLVPEPGRRARTARPPRRAAGAPGRAWRVVLG